MRVLLVDEQHVAMILNVLEAELIRLELRQRTGRLHGEDDGYVDEIREVVEQLRDASVGTDEVAGEDGIYA